MIDANASLVYGVDLGIRTGCVPPLWLSKHGTNPDHNDPRWNKYSILKGTNLGVHFYSWLDEEPRLVFGHKIKEMNICKEKPTTVSVSSIANLNSKYKN